MRSLRTVGLLVAALVLAGSCSSTTDGAAPSTVDAATTTVVSTSTVQETSTTVAAAACAPWVGEMVAEFAEAGESVGIAARVSMPGCDQQVAIGYDDLEAGTPLDPGDTFRIASITKTFTAALAVRLAELGVWSLDDRVGDYVEGDFGEITVEQILSHTSGLDDVGYEGSLWNYLTDPSAVVDRRTAIDAALSSTARLSPGSIQRYANVNYLVAGYAIEEASGSAIEDLLKVHIVDVLGLDSTGLETVETELPNHYERAPEAENPIPLSDLPTGIGSAAAWTAGGMVSSLDDLDSFASGLFSGAVVSEESLALMTDGFVDARSNYGLGLDLSSVGDTVVYGHNGRIIGFASAFRHAPDVGITVVVLSNDGVTDAPTLADELLTSALER